MRTRNRAEILYRTLLSSYGPQGWWPLSGKYHRGLPKTRSQRYEICLGAILTQNTAWRNVDTVLASLRQQKLLSPKAISTLSEKKLAALIRSSGYHNQKARKVKLFTEFFLSLRGTPSRADLLSLWGVGEETADSILLYAYGEHVFVVDAYTRRVASRMGLLGPDPSYSETQELFSQALPASAYNEAHALLVEHCKRSCRVRPVCEGCVVGGDCGFAGI